MNNNEAVSCGPASKSYGAGPTMFLSLIGLGGMVVTAMMMFGPKDNISHDGTLRYWVVAGPALVISLLAFILGQKGTNAAKRDGVKLPGMLKVGCSLGFVCAIVCLLFSLVLASWSM